MIPESTATVSTYTGNDIAYQFTFAFRALKASDIMVTATVGVADPVTLVQGVDYSFTFSSFPLAGGTITLIDAAQAWMTGATLKLNAILTIKYNVAPSQLSNLRNVTPSLLALEVEKALDKIAMDVAGLQEQGTDAAAATSSAFPALTDKAGLLVQVKADETGFEYLINAQTILDAQVAAAASVVAADASEAAALASENQALVYKNATAADRAAVVVIEAAVSVAVGQAAGHAVDAQVDASAAEASAILAAAQVPLATAQAVAAEASAADSERSANLLLYVSVVDLTFADSPYQVLAADKGKLFRIDTTGGNFVFNLPTMQPDATWRVSAVKLGNGGNIITTNPFGADTIDGGASDTLSTQGYGHTYYQNIFSDWTSDIFIDNGSNTFGTPGNVGGLEFSAVQNIAAGGQIIPGAAIQQAINVQGNGGPQNASTTPFTANPSDGVIIVLIGQDDAKKLTVFHNDSASGCMLKGDCYLGKDDTLAVVWNLTKQRYNELFRSVH